MIESESYYYLCAIICQESGHASRLATIPLRDRQRDEIMENSKYKILNTIQSPADLRKLKVEDLPLLCAELRDDIIHELSVNPGHLASSLGVVEITDAYVLIYLHNTALDTTDSDTSDVLVVVDSGYQILHTAVFFNLGSRYIVQYHVKQRYHICTAVHGQ